MLMEEFSWDRFLELVQQRPYLYDTNQPEYKDSTLKDRQWVKIGQQFGLTGWQAKNKWRNARDRYIKIRVQMKRSGRRVYDKMGIPIPNTKWQYYKTLDRMLRDAKQHGPLCQMDPMIKPKTEPTEYFFECTDAQEAPAGVTLENSHDADTVDLHRMDRPSSPEPGGASNRRGRRRDVDDDDDDSTLRGGEEASLQKSLDACIGQLVAMNRSSSSARSRPDASGDECHYHGMSIAARLRRLDDVALPQVLHRISAVLVEHGV
ncbi:uncharacterized protein [Dermacentor albipictus]|uniref:uncharacterized protein isoform X2 n=1 Tax=Dermacentor albipictus TaxID=60249 RepID=UPI0031FD42EA